MARVVSISIEGSGVKVVDASVGNTKTVVRDAFTFPLDQLDEFLSRERARDFILSVDFPDSFQETILLPPVKKNLVKPLLVAEVKKKNPSVEGDLVLVYFKTGEKSAEGKKQVEYFVLAVPASDVDNFLQSFLSRGKRVTALYPNMLAVLKILPIQEKPYICHYETGNKKNLFLIKNGKVLFTRSAASIGQGLVDYDIQNINMTINYCRQTIRVEPEEVLFVGESSGIETAAKTAVPMTFLRTPDSIVVNEEVLRGFLIPISALGKGESQSIFTDTYRRFYAVSSTILYVTRYAVLLSLLLGGVLGFNKARYSGLQEELAAIRSKNADIDRTMNENHLVRQEILTEKPMVNFMNRMYTVPSFSKFLYEMRNVQADGVDIQKFELVPAANRLALHMSGQITISTLYGAQKRLDKLAADLQGIKGIAGMTAKLSLKDRTFDIVGTWGEGVK